MDFRKHAKAKIRPKSSSQKTEQISNESVLFLTRVVYNSHSRSLASVLVHSISVSCSFVYATLLLCNSNSQESVSFFSLPQFLFWNSVYVWLRQIALSESIVSALCFVGRINKCFFWFPLFFHSGQCASGAQNHIIELYTPHNITIIIVRYVCTHGYAAMCCNCSALQCADLKQKPQKQK